ncbi:MAG: DUF3667 domain-containing protein [Sphingorhabdus sp.]
MSEEISGLADIATGAAIARAVEPVAGEWQGGNAEACLNCGTALVGANCHACGQKAQVHRTLHAFGHDFLHSVLHFDGKIWRTLPLLFWNPGELTRRYVHGERAKFVSPLALFLFTVFLSFAVVSWLSPSNSSTIFDTETAENEYQQARKEIVDDLVKMRASEMPADEIARKQQELKSLDESRNTDVRQVEAATQKTTAAKKESDAKIAQLEAELGRARAAGAPTKVIEENLNAQRVEAKVIESALTALGEKNVDTVKGDWRFTDLVFPGSKALNEAAKHAMDNPQLALYKIQSSAYKFSWALIPISVPFVWLLFFWHRQFKMFDHAVFVTYSLTFMMLLGVISAMLIQFTATEWLGGLALAFYPPIHMYRQLHHAYQTSRFGAFWRMCLLSLFAMTALTLFGMLIITLGVTG